MRGAKNTLWISFLRGGHYVGQIECHEHTRVMFIIFDSISEICHETDLIYEFRPHSTIFRTEISSRIHFWRLEGPEMVKIDQNLRFSITSQFSWGRPWSEPPAANCLPAQLLPPPAAVAAATACGLGRLGMDLDDFGRPRQLDQNLPLPILHND